MCIRDSHSSEDVWQTGLLYNVMYNRDCMVHVGTNLSLIHS